MGKRLHLPFGRRTGLHLLLLAYAWCLVPTAGTAQTNVVHVDTDQVIGHVDDKIYGQFLEHIYHSANGGIWGDVVFDRSFEEQLSKAPWTVRGSEFLSPASTPGSSAAVLSPTDSRFAVGSEAWKNYDATIDLRRTSPAGFITVGFRVTGKNGFAITLGADKNQHHVLDHSRGGWQTQTVEHEGRMEVDGSLKQNSWSTLRIRCEGRRAQIWLDGKLLFDDDHIDRENGQLTLAVTDGTAGFRNIKVMDLDGKGLLPDLPSPARHWTMVGGSATATLDSDKPLNSQLSLHLSTENTGEGIQQHHLSARAGDSLQGSLWLRGLAQNGVVVRILEDDKVAASQELHGITPEWKEFPLNLRPTATSPEATLQIVSAGKVDIWVDQVSLMPESFRANGGFRPDLLQAMADLHPSIVRWPGGSFVGEYEWKNGIGPQSKRIGKRGWDEWDPLSLGIDEYMQLVRKLGAEPLIVIYMGPQNAENRAKFVADARDFVEYCNGPASSKWGSVRAANGHPEPYHVKYWEIDNEVWGAKPDNYVKAIRDFSAGMKAVDPTISLIACGSGNFGGQWGEGDIAVIDQVADLVDYLSVHRYEGPDRFATGATRAELFWGQLAQRIAQSKNPHLKLFVSEWNAQSIDWRTGMYAAAELNAFEESPVVGMATPALFLRHVTAPSWDNAFINFDQSGWFPAPNYVVMKLYRDFFAPNLLRMTGVPTEISAVATRSSDGKTVIVKLVNTSDKPVKMRLDPMGNFRATGATMHQVAPGDLMARNSMGQPNLVHAVESKPDLKDKTIELELPRWSVSVLQLNGQ